MALPDVDIERWTVAKNVGCVLLLAKYGRGRHRRRDRNSVLWNVRFADAAGCPVSRLLSWIKAGLRLRLRCRTANVSTEGT